MALNKLFLPSNYVCYYVVGSKWKAFCGEIGGHNFTRTNAKTFVVDTTRGIPLTEYGNRSLHSIWLYYFGMELSSRLKKKTRSFNLHIMLPAQFTPSPVYPALPVHVKEPLVLVHSASSWQLCSPVSHSSKNQQVEVSYKNSIDLKVAFTVSFHSFSGSTVVWIIYFSFF